MNIFLTKNTETDMIWLSSTNIRKELSMPVKKVCVVCGKDFYVPPCREKKASTCSDVCAIVVRAKSRERKVTKVCPGCGIEFTMPKSHFERRVYCSTECKFKSDESTSKMSDRISGDKNPMWNGGETAHSAGYIYKLATHHPFASNGYVFKHRLIMEEWLKKESPDSKFLIKLGESLFLSPDANVHHIDEDKKNNRKRNLAVMSNSSHRTLHQGGQLSKEDYWPPTAKFKKHLNSNRGTSKDLVSLPGRKD